ncbi:tetratricopeptide repeat protein [Candidatus Poribacteria bacterium]|nr:tetratricopeptide repeat protein [Candidatus Poribacteria bacterium]
MKEKSDKEKNISEDISLPPDNVVDSTIQNPASHNQLLYQSLDATIQQRLNDFKSNFSETQSNSTNKLLFILCIALLLFIILIPIIVGVAGYIVYNEFDDVKKSALAYVKNAEQEAIKAEDQSKKAEEYLREIEKYQRKLGVIIGELTSKDFTNSTKTEIIDNSLQDIQNNPEFSREEKAILEAYKLQSKGNISEAIDKWRFIANTVIGVNSDMVSRAFFSIGYLHSLQDEHDQALSALDEAIKLNPNFIDAYTSRGILNHKLGNLEKSLIDFDSVIKLEPELVDAYINRGTVKRSMRNYQDAIEDYNIAISLDPNSPKALTNRGISYNDINKYEQAVADFDEAIRIDSGYVDAYINRGSAKRALGMKTEAKEDIDIALELSKQ